MAETYARYEAERTKRRLLDFDDLIGACGDALAGDSDFADRIRWRSRHLFVDEMQDVNPAQFRLLTAPLSDEPDLFVVGDPNQSVYGFNGADPTLLDRLPEILRGTKVIRLDENHRCTPQVVAVATAVLRDGGSGDVVPPSTTRVDGPVPQVVRHDTDHDEAAWAASRAKLARAPGRLWSTSPCWRAPTPSWPRCKPPWTPPACPAWWPAPIWGRPVTCAPRETAGEPEDGEDGLRAPSPSERDRVVLTTFHRLPRACNGRRSWCSVSVRASCRSGRPRRRPPSRRSAGSCTWR